jgi:hypothetical protein
MRVLKNLGIVHNQDYSLFPDGGIQNETTTKEGTPVIEEVYGDLLMNVYKYLRDRKIVVNDTQDNETNGYQLIQALKRNVNELNDVERTLQRVFIDTWSLGINFDLLPSKYFIFARASEDLVAAENVIYGTDSGDTIPFSSPTGFKASDEVLIILDKDNGARAYSLSGINGASVSVLENIMGTPLAFYKGSSNLRFYYDSGVIYNENFQSYNVLQALKTLLVKEEVEIYEVFLIDEKFVIVSFEYDLNRYQVFYSEQDTPDNLTVFTLEGFSFENEDDLDYEMHTFYGEGKIYFSNGANTESNNNKFVACQINFTEEKIEFVSSSEIDEEYQKTTNSFVNQKGIYTLINGKLEYCNWSGTQYYEIGDFPIVNAVLFNENDSPYITTGEVKKPINLPIF